MSVADKFWDRVDHGSEDGCWEYEGPRLPVGTGYGKFWLIRATKKKEGAHRRNRAC